MSEQLANDIALWIIIPTVIGIFIRLLVPIFTLTGIPRRLRRRRRERQLAELKSIHAEARGRALEIDWMRFKELADTEIASIVGKVGWRPAGEEIGKRTWLLRFELAGAAPGDPGVYSRLRTTLREAKADSDGTYLLDTEQYRDLEVPEIEREVNAAGWLVAGLEPSATRPHLRLTRRDTSPVSAADPTFIQGFGPEQLREDPEVVARAAVIKREKGFDPLSGPQLNRVRERHRYWQKKFNRRVLLATFYTIVGFVLLGAFSTSSEPDWESGSAYVILAIPIVLLLLAALTIYQAVRIRRARKAEIGDFLAAYNELDRLARQ